MATLAIKLDSPTPINDQIVAGLRRAIATGELKPDDELPPVRQLAADLGVNLNTVARAYRVLEASGLVSVVRGRGTRVRSSTQYKNGDATALIEQRLADVVADAKLAGISAVNMQKVFDEVLVTFFHQIKPRRGERCDR